MFLKLTDFNDRPIIIAVSSIQGVKAGQHSPAYGGGILSRIWCIGNSTDTPDYLVSETPDEVWEKLKHCVRFMSEMGVL